ncbi:SpoIIIAH-like family protein [Paenibacillus sp. LMG 31456]|uniref:SpoIIIAH-like family protein n=1 Tax=Paenibacillus foliorum TaxID=2654974 RepID=A0A972GVI3_9BACL|nr:SpoIIIAH-like family protein [Paenibacillus foliorum]NOU97676.1 SpoIIIAH-like family protein [Paenibacillus foliorum]
MNSKRQTIWLVSMLSLMVVLSAYYLFTEDVNNLQFSSKETTKSTGTTSTMSPSTKEIVVNTNDLNVNPTPSGAQTDKKASAATTPEMNQQSATPVKPEQKESSVKTDPSKGAQSNAAQSGAKSNTATDAKAAQPTAKADTQVSAADAKVLQQVMTQAKSGTDYFTNIGLKRNEDLAKQTEKWMTIISDPKQTAEAAAKAESELRKIQDNEAKVTSLEETLMKEFPQAVITEESSKWKITVQSNKLEKSQAVSIIEKVMNEMNVGAEKIVVQYVP